MGWMRAVVRRGVSVVVVSGPLREEGVAEPVTHSTRESRSRNTHSTSPEATDTTTVSDRHKVANRLFTTVRRIYHETCSHFSCVSSAQSLQLLQLSQQTPIS